VPPCCRIPRQAIHDHCEEDPMDNLDLFYDVVSVLAIPINFVHFVVWSTLEVIFYNILGFGPGA
jgi:hypothetical protein